MHLSLRSILSGAATTVLILLAAQAHAAGSVVIEQQSPIGDFGDYTLTFPAGTQVTVTDQERKEMTAAAAGTYLLHLTPPSDAKMTTTVTKNGAELIVTTDRDVRFTVADGDAFLIAINYRYDGTVSVESDPVGASFELLGPNGRRSTGRSPVTYTGLPPGAYRVTFHKRSDCNLVSPIQRTLDANTSLTFIGNYVCGVATPPAPPPVTPEEPIQDVNDERAVRIWIAAHQAEALAGGAVRTTITVRNIGTRTIHNVVVSAQISPEEMAFVEPLPHFGRVNGDTAVWETPQIFAGKTWSITVPLALNASLRQGSRPAVTARVSADDLAEGNADSTLLASTRIGVTGLPVTGMRLDVLFLILSTVFTAVLAKKTIQQRPATERA